MNTTEPTVLHPQMMIAPQSATAGLLHMIERVARDPGVDMNVLERLMAMRERVVADERRMSFNEAVGKAKAAMPEIQKNRTVSFNNGKTAYAYEDLAEIERTITKTLSTHGLSYRWRTDSLSKPGMVIVTCIVSHSNGHSEENSLSAATATSGSMSAIQALGSAVTYLERYTLKAALGLAASTNAAGADDDDDDGAAAGKVEVKVKVKGEDEVVSDEQALEIANLIAETKTNIVVFLEYVKAPSVSDIPAKEFDRIVGLLKRKKGTS